MARHPVRRGQLIVPFGVGALAVFPDGISMMVAGLDHWYSPRLTSTTIDDRPFVIDEWRLRAKLKVDQFRLPPDFRHRRSHFDAEKANQDMKVPALRFPLEHACAKCNRLTTLDSTQKTTPRCHPCETTGRPGRLNQVQFIAMCERGHIQDFPFREWVHRSVKPPCDKPIQVFASGGASLLGVHVKCECGKQRNLAGITDANDQDGTTMLSHSLAEAKGETYLCRGERPWLDDVDPDACAAPLRGGLRSASNTYFATTVSAIFVPQYIEGVPAELLDKLQAPPLSADIALFKTMPLGNITVDVIGAGLKKTRAGLEAYEPSQVGQAVKLLVAGIPTAKIHDDLKISEYEELRRERAEPQLKVRLRAGSDYESWLGDRLKAVALVDKLRETRAFVGFSRLSAHASSDPVGVYRQLWRHWPPKLNWLPASVVFGEGLLLELEDGRLSAWERRPDVRGRVGQMQKRHEAAVLGGARIEPRELTPRFVLLHTLAHLVIQRLSFESGYAAASLAERIYASPELGMAGVLIYTAAGDSEGTLGGLVRLGRPGLLEPVVRRAVERAHWCSADPICMELGEGGGQGPNSCNSAACHNCALLPETACEDFNRYLDRAMLIGTPEVPDLGFFAHIDQLDLVAAAG